MSTNTAKNIFGKVLLLSVPFLALLMVYVKSDPYRVLRRYYFNNYYNWQPNEINRDYVSFENLQQRLLKKEIPNDYIMGNSRSLVFRTGSWQQRNPHVTAPYHFDAASETLLGVYQKAAYLHQNNLPFHNLLLVCDASLLSKNKNDEDAVHIKHSGISNQNWLQFHLVFIKTFFSSFFCFKWMHYHLNGHHILSYMKDVFAIAPGYITTEAHTNNYYYSAYEEKIKEDSIAYYQVTRKEEFYNRPDTVQQASVVLGQSQLELLRELAAILKAGNTHVKIIISPLYDQKPLAAADLQQLQQIFGKENIFDFSGRNTVTNAIGNYYESSHFKPYVAEMLMDSVYKNEH